MYKIFGHLPYPGKATIIKHSVPDALKEEEEQAWHRYNKYKELQQRNYLGMVGRINNWGGGLNLFYLIETLP